MKKIIFSTLTLLLCSLLYGQQIIGIRYREFEPPVHSHFFVDTPESACWPVEYRIDLDQDGTNDYVFERHGGYQYIVGIWLDIHPMGNYWVDWPPYCIRQFQIGDTIANAVWNPDNGSSNAELLLYTFGTFFLGIRHQKEEGYCYGWVEFDLECGDILNGSGYPETIDLYFRRVAYCTIPDYPLLAGQTDFTWSADEHFKKNAVYDPLGYVYTMNQTKRPTPSSNSNIITLPITNQPVGSRYLIKWYDSVTGNLLNPGILDHVFVQQDLQGNRFISFYFPSLIRDLQQQTINNKFGDAVFSLTLDNQPF